MSFKLRTEGGARLADRDEIRRALAVLIDPGQTFELRGLYRNPSGEPCARSRVCKADDLDAAVEAAFEMSDCLGVYWTLNPCNTALGGPARKKDIVGRRWLPIDCDPVKPKDASATDEEKRAAIELACEVADHLASMDWPAPVWIDSGNGAWLLYPIGLPADAASQQLVKDVLAALARRFNNDRAIIDPALHDANRIGKLPGTVARKGPDTPERPHRMARLISVPKHGGEEVTVEMMEAVGRAKADPSANGHARNPWAARATDQGLGRYVQSAIERECARVLMATAHTAEGRNVSLNVAAFNLATMARWPEMVAADAKIALYQAAIRSGLDDGEAKKTLESGWSAGSQPGRERARPAPTHADGAVRKAPIPPAPNGRMVIFGSEVRPKKVRWLWPDRIAVGFISLFAGRTGIGKSFVLCDFAARMTTGGQIPESMICVPKGRVLMISEDPYDYVLAPRLREMGADMDMIGFLTWEAMSAYTLSDIGMLERAWKEAGEPGLIVIDPPTNFLSAKDEHKNAEVRQILMVIVSWLASKDVACVMITHVSKPGQKGVEAVDRIMGSVAWASTARVAVGIAPDPHDASRCLMAGIKNNLGPKAETLAFRIAPTDSLAKVVWMGKVDTTADEAMNNVPKKSVGRSVVEWYEEQFRIKREWSSNELKEKGLAYGFTFNALCKSPEYLALPILKKERFDGEGKSLGWFKIAKPGWPPESPESPESPDGSRCDARENPLSGQRTREAEIPESGGLSGLSGVSPVSGDVPTPETPIPFDADLESPGKRLERRRFKIGTWIRNLLWGAPAPGDYVLKLAVDAGFEESEIREVAKLVGVDMSQDTWVYRGF